ncbi:hypothetical protein [Azospirillum melinis]
MSVPWGAVGRWAGGSMQDGTGWNSFSPMFHLALHRMGVGLKS